MSDLGAELLAHLDEQLRSVGRLRAAVDALGAAVRLRDVDAVVRHTGTIEAETTFRSSLEERRSAVVRRGSAVLGLPPYEVTVAALCAHLHPDEARAATACSERLMRETEDVAREHRCNRALMRQELSFLDHLLRLGGAPPEVTYAPHAGRGHTRTPAHASSAPAVPHRVLDLRA